jgi:hypothetical protein
LRGFGGCIWVGGKREKREENHVGKWWGFIERNKWHYWHPSLTFKTARILSELTVRLMDYESNLARGFRRLSPGQPIGKVVTT